MLTHEKKIKEHTNLKMFTLYTSKKIKAILAYENVVFMTDLAIDFSTYIGV